jgi:nitrite transporter
MSLLGLGLFQPHGDTISWYGYLRNLVPVTLGNIIGGGIFVGALYWFVSPVQAALRQKEEVKAVEPQLVTAP